MDKEKRREFLLKVIARNKSNNYFDMTIDQILAPMNELYNLQWDIIWGLLQEAKNENKKNYKRRENRMLGKN